MNAPILQHLAGPLCLTNEHDPAVGLKVSTLIERLSLLPDWAKADAYLTLDRRTLDDRTTLALCLSAETPFKRVSFLSAEILTREQSHAILSACPSYAADAVRAGQLSPIGHPATT